MVNRRCSDRPSRMNLSLSRSLLEPNSKTFRIVALSELKTGLQPPLSPGQVFLKVLLRLVEVAPVQIEPAEGA